MTLKPSPMLNTHSNALVGIDMESSKLVSLFVREDYLDYSKVLLNKDDVLVLINHLQECYNDIEDYDYD